METSRAVTRRTWLAAAVSAVALARPRAIFAQLLRLNAEHPEPRAGVTSAKVATPEMLQGDPVLTELFDGIRTIPHVVDGIRCHCGCADLDGHYSLLSCYEGENAMARICPICQGEGRVALRLTRAGKSLADIRIAIDAQFG